MADTAEKVIVTVEAKLDATSAKQAEAQFDQSMNNIKASAGKAEAVVAASSAKLGNSMTGVGAAATKAGGGVAQMSQMLTAGRAPLVALTTQATSMAGALAGGGGAMGGGIAGAATKVAAIMGGGGIWYMAITGAIMVVTALVKKHFEEGDALDELFDKLVKSKAQVDLNNQADERWKLTIDGIIESIKKRTEAQKRLNETNAQAAQGDLQQSNVEAGLANDRLNTTRNQLAAAQTALARRRRELRAAESGAGAGSSTDAASNVLSASQAVDAAAKRVDTLQTQVNRLQRSANDAAANVRGAQVAIISDQLETSGATVSAINKRYDALEKRTKDAARNDEFLLKNLRATLALQRQLRDAEVDRAREAEKASRKAGRAGGGSGLYGGQIDQAEAAALARRAGFQVNSSERSTARQRELYNAWVAKGSPADTPVAKPGTSAHEPGGSKWALDIQRTAGVTAASITKAFADAGIRLTKIITEHQGRVFHIEGSRSEAAGAERAEARDLRAAQREQEQAAREAARLQQEENEKTARFNAEMLDLDDKLAAAKTGRATSMQQLLEQDQAEIDRKIANQNADYMAAAQRGFIREADAKLLVIKNNQIGDAEKAQLAANEQRRIANMNAQLAMDQQENQIAALAYEVEIAKTGEERRAASLALLNAEIELQRSKLEQIKANELIGSYEWQRAEAALQNLEAERARGTQRVNSDPGNMSPGQRYLDDLDQTAAEINESLENVAVQGLDRLTDGLTQAIMGTKKLGEVFKEVAAEIIASLIKIAIQQMIMKPLAEALFGGGGGGGGGQYFGVLGGLFGGLGGGGGGGSFYTGVGGDLFGGFFADGGRVSGGKPIIVGERGIELFTPDQSGLITPNDALAKVGRTSGQGGNTTVALTVNAPGATAETVSMIRRELAAAAPTLVSAAQRATISSLTRTRT